MALDPHALPQGATSFMIEPHVATITTLRPDGTAHVVPVNFTWQAEGAVVRVITSATSAKARNLAGGGRAVVCSVDGGRWLSLEGTARVSTDADEVEDAVARYTDRYHPPRRGNEGRAAIIISVDKVLGRV